MRGSDVLILVATSMAVIAMGMYMRNKWVESTAEYKAWAKMTEEAKLDDDDIVPIG